MHVIPYICMFADEPDDILNEGINAAVVGGIDHNLRVNVADTFPELEVHLLTVALDIELFFWLSIK